MSSMRQAIDELRYRWVGVRIGGPDATMRGQWAVLSVSLVVVFACFFAIGRLRAGGSAASPAAAPSALARPSGQPAIPTGLSGGSPIAGAVPVAIAVQPRRPAVAPQAKTELQTATPSQSLNGEASRSESTVSESQSSSAPAPEPEAASRPLPTKASAPSPTGGGSGSSGQRPATRSSQSSGGGGASFDSSE